MRPLTPRAGDNRVAERNVVDAALAPTEMRARYVVASSCCPHVVLFVMLFVVFDLQTRSYFRNDQRDVARSAQAASAIRGAA
jgi:hypothetical protein